MKVDNRSLADYSPDTYIPMFCPPIIVDKHFPTAFCQHLVANIDSFQASPSGVYDSTTHQGTVDNYHRSSSFISVGGELYDDTAKLMTTAVNMYAVSMLSKTATLSESLQFLKYDSKNKGHFLAHTDNAYYDSKGVFQHTNPERHLTCVAYINDAYEGGDFIMHTVRDDEGNSFRIKPNVGELVIFPSDTRFLHEVTNVTAGCRYSIVGWFNLK